MKQSDEKNEILRKAEELEENFRILAHDLYAPLRHILSFNELLQIELDKSNLSNSENISLFLEKIKNSAKQMNNMFSSINIYNELNTKKPKNHYEKKIDMNIVANEAILQLEAPKVSAANITVETLPTISGSAFELSILLQNLIKNAVYHNSSSQPALNILYDNKDKTFAIKDNGVGIDESIHKKIFKPFFYYTNELVSKYSLAGWGLTLCKKIIENHKGNIWFEANSNEGTTFYFTLDLSATN